MAQHRRALLALADDLGAHLRGSGQVATGLTCTVRYADSSDTRRSRTLPEATFVPHGAPGPRGVRGIRIPRAPTRQGPQHRSARRRPSPGRPGHPATHPRQRRRQAPGDRSRRRPGPRPVRAQRALPGSARERRQRSSRPGLHSG
ncbi:DinB/UmuC family translesion DNA polymerase [Streptomyces avermitilis]